MQYWYMCSWRVSPVFVRANVHCEIQEILTYPAIVQQRVSLAGRTVSDHFLTGAPRVDQEFEQRTLGLLNLLTESLYRYQGSRALRSAPVELAPQLAD